MANDIEIIENKKLEEKPRGRPPGSRNKNSFLVRKALDNHNFDLIGELLQISAQLKPLEQAQLLVQLLPYAYPKIKDTELRDLPKSDPMDNDKKPAVSSLLAAIKDK